MVEVIRLLGEAIKVSCSETTVIEKTHAPRQQNMIQVVKRKTNADESIPQI